MPLPNGSNTTELEISPWIGVPSVDVRTRESHKILAAGGQFEWLHHSDRVHEFCSLFVLILLQTSNAARHFATILPPFAPGSRRARAATVAGNREGELS
jgi:hypothetical protein